MHRSVVCFALLAAGAFSTALLCAQQPLPGGGEGISSRGPARLNAQQTIQRMFGGSPGGRAAVYPGGEYEEMYGGAHNAKLQKLDVLKKKLKESVGSDRQEAVAAEVKAAIGEYFDYDMQQRQTKLDQLKQRADAMTAALETRQAAKDELVDLQLKSFRYEAEGLGLFTERGTSVTDSVPGMAPFGTSVAFAVPGAGGSIQIINPLQAAMSSVSSARKKLVEAKSEEEETQAATELRKALAEYFDRDMEFRRQELKEVQAELEQMTTALQKRAGAKSQIVELQLQILVNEARGLGFFRTQSTNRRGGGGGAFGTMRN